MHLPPPRPGPPAAAFPAVALLLVVLVFAPRASASVYWGNHLDDAVAPGTTIGRANNDGTAVNRSFIGGAAPVTVAVDAAHIYWVNQGGSIGRANLDGTGVNQDFITGLSRFPDWLAVDAGHIYWSHVVVAIPFDAHDDAIGRANLDGTGVDENFITGAAEPRGVAVDGGHVYWTNLGDDTIGRANLDGSGVNQSFIDAGFLAAPSGVAVDAGHIYWSSPTNGAIGRANLNGSGVDPNFIAGINSPWGVAVDPTHIYWASQILDADGVSSAAISRANLDGTGVNESLVTGLGSVIGVAVDGTPAVQEPSRISIDDVSMGEGNAGETAFQFTVSLDAPQSAPVTVDFATADGTASAPDDYAATTGTVTFAPGETAKTVTVQVDGDTDVEPGETFTLNLSNATGNATIADATGVATILNDDQPLLAPASRISIDDVSEAEGNAGETAFQFSVSLDRKQSAPVTVDFATANGTATAPGDYAANVGTLTFAPGETSEAVTVQVNGDTRKESDESFGVSLSHVSGAATIADGQAVGTIVNDDGVRAPRAFTLGKAVVNPRTGTARLAVTVPGPGTVTVSGRGATAAGAAAARSVRAAGTVGLLIRASGQKQRTLNRTGMVAVTARVIYTPIGGVPQTRSKNIRLQKRH